MKRLIFLAALALLCSCATATNSAKRVCSIYTDVRPDVVAIRTIIAAGIDQYPPDVQAKLKRIDAYLPELDAIGKASCSFARFDEGKAIEILIDVVKIAGELKGSGVI